MEFRAEQKYLLMSPRKIRLVVAAVKKLSPVVAIDVLSQMNKRASGSLSKVIKSAMANAKNKGVSGDTLIFSEIQIGEGPRLKRGNPVSRGMWHPIQKKMSHIRVVLTTRKSETPSSNVQKDEKTKKSKK